MKFRGACVLALLFTLTSACHFRSERSATGDLDQSQLVRGVISDRPIKEDNVIATVKLTNPPLLAVAKMTDQGLVVPEEAKKDLADEQDRVIGELKSLAPDVKVLFRYRMVLNGLSILGPASLKAKLSGLRGVQWTERANVIGRPVLESETSVPSAGQGFTTTPVDFIEAKKVQDSLKDAAGQPIRGAGVRIGVIDTGIDYTHKMLGGSGLEADYKSIDPAQPSAAFPNQKVVGGIDLVGTDYDAASEVLSHRLPVADANPLDEAGHGSHVAGTIAGLGDGINTYSGVAPEGKLYAIKVFGANGSTSDDVVIAGLEYAADPNQDGNPDDRLDAVNLSLGGNFGQPQVLYSEAVHNLTLGGTVVVASAGNSGPIDYIVGAPSTAADAISVAASIDDMPHNWTFAAAEFHMPNNPNLLARSVEGPISKPLSEAGAVQGELVYIGLGDQPLSEELKAKVKGQIAFLERGGVPFLQKLKLAESAGAIGAVVANNQPGEPIAMGGEGHVAIPAIMVTKDVGDLLKAESQLGPIVANLNSGKTIEDRSLIDTITSFSSKGPRSDDSLLKPEIAAPGLNIVSAKMGSGDKGAQLSGTSMSGPHIAGVVGLLRQYHPRLSVEEIKSLLLTTALPIHDSKANLYPLSLQGAGRVRTFAAAEAPLAVSPAALSLGTVQVGLSKTLRRSVLIKNILSTPVQVKASAEDGPQLHVSLKADQTLAPGETAEIPVTFVISAEDNFSPLTELNAQVLLHVATTTGAFEQHVSVIAMVTKISDIAASRLLVHAASERDGAGADTELTLINQGDQEGLALPFNLIGYDSRKPRPGETDSFRSRGCDLESAGYRIVEKVVDNEKQPILQFAVKLFEPTTTWHDCEISIQTDANDDQLADQELVGISQNLLSGLSALDFSSLLLDANKARAIRLDFEQKLAAGEEAPLSYADSILDVEAMTFFNQSTVAIVEAPLKLVNLRSRGELAVKIATLDADPSGFHPDDFLGGNLMYWHRLDPNMEASGYYNLPEVVALKPGEQKTVNFTRGAGQNPLLVYFPNNRSARTVLVDPQATELKPVYDGRATP